jgi:hypothetical protein
MLDEPTREAGDQCRREISMGFIIRLLGGLAGALIGYAAVAAAGVAYLNLARIPDVDGGGVMSVFFGAAPLGGLVGLMLGAMTATWLRRRSSGGGHDVRRESGSSGSRG